MAKDVFRIVTRGADGKIRIKDYAKHDAIGKMHVQVGIDDCSTDLELRGMPVFQGLIGPIPEGKNIVRYESPEVFETLTKEWSTAKSPRRTRRKPFEIPANHSLNQAPPVAPAPMTPAVEPELS